MFILKEVKVVCFDTLLQVLILKNLYFTKIMIRCVSQELANDGLRPPGRLPKAKNASRDAGGRDARRNVIQQLLYARSNRLSRKKAEAIFMTSGGSTWNDRSDATDCRMVSFLASL